jgi:hypothetical protein
VIGVPGSARQGRPPGDRARVLRRPFALHDRDHRQLLVRHAIGLHVAQYRDREQSRWPQRPIGLLELAGETGRRDDIAGAPDAGAAALAMGDQHRLAQPRSDRRGGVPDMDHERAAANRGAVDCDHGKVTARSDPAPLFHLFYQVEIRRRQLPQKAILHRLTSTDPTRIRCECGNCVVPMLRILAPSAPLLDEIERGGGVR